MSVVQGLGLILWAFWWVFMGLRCLAWLRRGRGFRPGSTSLGNALQTLQVYVEPRVQHVIQERLEEEAEEEVDGDSVDPATHIKRQAERIRRGEEVGRITALLR